MRIATYNIEWFNALFDRKNRLMYDDEWSARYKVTRAQQIDALARVFSAMDADAVMVIEAPDSSHRRSTVAALENFAEHFGLRTRIAVTGFANETKQEIALLYDPDKLIATHQPRPGQGEVPRFDGEYTLDLDQDGTKDLVRFSKPPLELSVVTSEGYAFHMIGVHLKSKAPHGAETPKEVKRVGIANRRKQLAQAVWLRARIDQLLSEDVPLIVLGDLNDGPGLDNFESLLGRSSVEIVLGEKEHFKLFDPHADRALSQRLGPVPTTSRFWIRPEKRYLQALLDYIMVSETVCQFSPKWRIWHPLDDPRCWADPTLREALVTASDHFPVSVDLAI